MLLKSVLKISCVSLAVGLASTFSAMAATCFYGNVKECSSRSVCEKATTYVSSTEKVWKDQRGTFSHFVAEAKLRGLSCGVANDIRALNQCNYDNENLKEIQGTLKDFSFYTGRIDGIMGPGTRSAFRKANNLLQRSNGEQPCLTSEHMARLDIAHNILVGEVEQKSGPSLQGVIAENTVLREELQKLYRQLNNGAMGRQSSEVNQNYGIASASRDLGMLSANEDQTYSVSDRSKLELLEEVEAGASELEKQLAAKNEAINDLNKQLNDSRSSEMAENDLENEAAEAKRQLNAVNLTVAEQSQKILALSSRVEQLKAEAERVDNLTRLLAAANGTIADLREDLETDSRVLEIKRALEAANQTIADLRGRMAEDYVSLLKFRELQRQLAAASTTIANLRDQISQEYVSREAYAELQRQLGGANRVLADLREELDTDFVSLSQHMDQLKILKDDKSNLQKQLNASLTTVADLRDEIDINYVANTEYFEVNRQLQALNGALVELQEANDSLRDRVIESDRLFANFREDCRSQPECARAMRLAD